MKHSDELIVVLYCQIRSNQWGVERDLLYRQSKRDFLKLMRQRGQWDALHRCPECKQKMPREMRSIDHIIPVWVLRAYRMPNLEFDHRNFRVICQPCNGARGHRERTIETVELPPRVKERIMLIEPIPTEPRDVFHRIQTGRALVIH